MNTTTSLHFTIDNTATTLAHNIMPYSAFIGLEIGHDQQGKLFHLPFKPELIGNIFLPALHGGLIGGMMESAAALFLYQEAKLNKLPKMIDFSLDYLRSGRPEPLYTRCTLTRQGTRIAHISVNAFQRNEDKPIATARCHLQLPVNNI